MIPIPTREELVEQYHSENMTFKQIAESYKEKLWMLWSKAELKTLQEPRKKTSGFNQRMNCVKLKYFLNTISKYENVDFPSESSRVKKNRNP